jgi:phosphatidylglycerol:prolipoprotein diacylglycerol transferase
MKPALLLYPHIGSYSFFLVLGFVCGWFLARKRAQFFGIKPSHLDNISLLLPFAGLFGARLFARLFYAKLPLLEALKVWEGDGLVFYGGFVFGVASVIAYGLLRGIRLIALCDCLAPSVAVGLAFGRMGCFMAGCCWGDICVDTNQLTSRLDPVTQSRVQTFPAISQKNWFLAMRFPPGSEAFKQHVKLELLDPNAPASLPVHPVQLYESLLAALLAMALHMRFRGTSKSGSASIALLFGYAGIRFITEFLRADNKAYALGLTFSQVVSIEIATVACVWLFLRRFYYSTRLERAAPASISIECESSLRRQGGETNDSAPAL